MNAEVKLTHAIVKALNQIPGVLCWRRNVGAMKGGRLRFGKKGQVDIDGIVRGGRRLELEVKIDAKLTDEQAAWLATMTSYGALTGVVRSIDDAIRIVTASSS